MPRSLDAFHDSGRVLRLAAETFFDHLSEMCEGILVVDKSARIVWVNDRWQRNIASLGFSNADEIIGRPVEEVVPNTLMRHVVETGKPILLDILENKAGTGKELLAQAIHAASTRARRQVQGCGRRHAVPRRDRRHAAGAAGQAAARAAGARGRAAGLERGLAHRRAGDRQMLPKEIDRDALDALAAMPWPGNVRELRNVLERAAIREALRATGGNRLRAARRLGIARATLYQKLGEFPELAGSAAAAGSGSGKAA